MVKNNRYITSFQHDRKADRPIGGFDPRDREPDPRRYDQWPASRAMDINVPRGPPQSRL